MMPIGQAVSMVRCGRRFVRFAQQPPPDAQRMKLLDLPIAGRCLLRDISRNRHRDHTAILPRMKRAFHTFLLWLLIAALPLQGFAAALQASCGTSAHHAAAETAAPAQSHAQHDHEASAGHHDDTGDTGDIAAKHKHSSCSACAACCIGAIAPPSASLASMAYSNARPAVSAPAPLLTGFIPPGLERPPKRVTA